MRSIKLADILGKKVDDDDILKLLAPQISLPPRSAARSCCRTPNTV